MKTLSPQVRHVIFGQWVALLLLMVTSLILYVQFFRLSECQSNYMAQQAAAQQARATAADTERTSLRQVFEAIVAGNREHVQVEIAEHAQLLVENDRLREQNPVPPTPTHC